MRPSLSVGAVLIALTLSPEPANDTDMQRVEVAAILPLEGEGALLLLEAKGTGAVLPLVIGLPEASAIEAGRLKAVPPRPLTHDLLASAVLALGAAVSRVDIDSFQNSVFLAKVRLAQSGRDITLDARPSDSVALALRTGAGIFAATRVLEEHGLSRAELDNLRRRPGDLERRLRGAEAEGTRL